MKPGHPLLNSVRLLLAAFLLRAFAANASVVFTSLHSFGVFTNGASPYVNDGANPNSLVQGSDGSFYGTTHFGGTNIQAYGGYGTVFKITGNGIFTSLYSFTDGSDGADPYGGLIQAGDGDFYGTTGEGIFRISPNRPFTNLYTFPLSGGPTLIEGSDGSFFGTTGYGGANNNGTVFKIGADGTFTNVYSFTGGNDGANPNGLIQGKDGDFYGTTARAGTQAYGGNGTVFKISPIGIFSSLHSFTGDNDGSNPNGLVQGRDGSFYGTTEYGGTIGGNGTVFRISADGTFTNLYSFTGGYDGANPNGLIQGKDGDFYGTTEYGGTIGGNGTVFKISADGTFTNLYSFTGGNDGSNPNDIIQGNDGNFYGTTKWGGLGGKGTLFRLIPVPVAPSFQPVELADGVLNLTWSTERGATYQLQYNFELNSTNWIDLGLALNATGATLSARDYVTNAAARFYRALRLTAL